MTKLTLVPWKVTQQKLPFMDLKYFEIPQEINNPQMYYEDVFFCHTRFRSKSVGLLSIIRNKIGTSKTCCFETNLDLFRVCLSPLKEEITWWYEKSKIAPIW